jgi:predicted amidohydrolase
MRIAALQMRAVPGDVAANLGMVAEAAAEAARGGAEILVAPELATTGYGAGDAILDLAEPVGGPQIMTLADAAAAHGIAIVCGFAERAGGTVYNSAALITPDGRRTVYRKCHLYGGYERKLFTPGSNAPGLVELGRLRLGLLICYDVEFPESVRRLAVRGADLIVVPTALPESEHAAFIAERVVPVRAFENQVALVYANHAGADALFTYAGRSCIALPDGTDAARASAGASELIVADYEPARFVACREANPYLADRRADLF